MPPTSLHGLLIRSFRSDLKRQLFAPRGDIAAAIFAKVCFPGSADILFSDGSVLSPDWQVATDHFKFPAAILEVADSQSKKDGHKSLRHLADMYITSLMEIFDLSSGSMQETVKAKWQRYRFGGVDSVLTSMEMISLPR